MADITDSDAGRASRALCSHAESAFGGPRPFALTGDEPHYARDLVVDVKHIKLAPGRSMTLLPLWFSEGMAEYLSVGRIDTNTRMWLRDAVHPLAAIAGGAVVYPLALWALGGIDATQRRILLQVVRP